MDWVGLLVNSVVMILIFFVGSYIYTKFIMRYVIKKEISNIINELSDKIKNDGETKERLKEIIDTVIDEASRKISELIKSKLSNDNIPKSLKKILTDDV